MKNVNILGTEYSIEIDDTLEKTELDGDKRISIRNAGSMLDDDDSTGVKKIRFDEVLRHEIIHAFFYEAGLEDYSDNEQLVDWIAKQFPKLEKAFKEADCL